MGLVGDTHTCVVMHVTYSKVKYEEEDTCVTHILVSLRMLPTVWLCTMKYL